MQTHGVCPTWSNVRLSVHDTQTMPLRLGCQSTAGKHLFLLYVRCVKERNFSTCKSRVNFVSEDPMRCVSYEYIWWEDHHACHRITPPSPPSNLPEQTGNAIAPRSRGADQKLCHRQVLSPSPPVKHASKRSIQAKIPLALLLQWSVTVSDHQAQRQQQTSESAPKDLENVQCLVLLQRILALQSRLPKRGSYRVCMATWMPSNTSMLTCLLLCCRFGMRTDLLQKVEEHDVLEEHLDLLVGSGDRLILQGLAHFAEPKRGGRSLKVRSVRWSSALHLNQWWRCICSSGGWQLASEPISRNKRQT